MPSKVIAPARRSAARRVKSTILRQQRAAGSVRGGPTSNGRTGEADRTSRECRARDTPADGPIREPSLNPRAREAVANAPRRMFGQRSVDASAGCVMTTNVVDRPL